MKIESLSKETRNFRCALCSSLLSVDTVREDHGHGRYTYHCNSPRCDRDVRAEIVWEEGSSRELEEMPWGRYAGRRLEDVPVGYWKFLLDSKTETRDERIAKYMKENAETIMEGLPGWVPKHPERLGLSKGDEVPF